MRRSIFQVSSPSMYEVESPLSCHCVTALLVTRETALHLQYSRYHIINDPWGEGNRRDGGAITKVVRRTSLNVALG